MWLDEMRTTGYHAPRRSRCAPDLPTRAQPLACSRVGVREREGVVTPKSYTGARRGRSDRGHTARVRRCALAALRVAADVTLRTPFGEGQLRPAVRACAEEIRLEPLAAGA